MFPMIYAGELSTVFLDLRYFLIVADMKESVAYDIVNAVFALTFVVTRVFVYGYGIFSILQVQEGIRERLPLAQVAMLGLLPLGWVMNAFWGRIIAMKVVDKMLGNSKNSVKQTRVTTVSS